MDDPDKNNSVEKKKTDNFNIDAFEDTNSFLIPEVQSWTPKSSIQVFARIRPNLKNGISRKIDDDSYLEEAVHVSDDRKEITVNTSKHQHGTKLDHIFNTECSQEDVFDCIKPSIYGIIQGYNCTIFVYGQTGTGKTYTMLGEGSEGGNITRSSMSANNSYICPSTWGIIPRTACELFRLLKDTESESIAHHDVSCSYLQIYNDKVYDLLQDRRRQKALKIHEFGTSGQNVNVQGLSEYRVTSANEVLNLIEIGCRNRAVRSTEYNEASSRSHVLLQLYVEIQQEKKNGGKMFTKSKLNLVDLAGSERWNTNLSHTYKESRTKEMTHINQSLSALGNVICALSDDKRRHVPFRDSKLTRLLQDSLGGNTCTTIITTLSLDAKAAEESASTIQFADRAKNVRVTARVNKVVDDSELLLKAQKEIERLRELLKSKNLQKLEELERQVLFLQEENTTLKCQLHANNSNASVSSEEFGISDKVSVEYKKESNNQTHEIATEQMIPKPVPEVKVNEKAKIGNNKPKSKTQRGWNDGIGGTTDEKGRWKPQEHGIPEYKSLVDTCIYTKRSNSRRNSSPKERQKKQFGGWVQFLGLSKKTNSKVSVDEDDNRSEE